MDNDDKVREDNLCDVLTDTLLALPGKVDADGYIRLLLRDAFWNFQEWREPEWFCGDGRRE